MNLLAIKYQIDQLNRRYNPENDLIPDAPMVTSTDKAILDILETLVDTIMNQREVHPNEYLTREFLFHCPKCSQLVFRKNLTEHDINCGWKESNERARDYTREIEN